MRRRTIMAIVLAAVAVACYAYSVYSPASKAAAERVARRFWTAVEAGDTASVQRMLDAASDQRADEIIRAYQGMRYSGQADVVKAGASGEPAVTVLVGLARPDGYTTTALTTMANHDGKWYVLRTDPAGSK